MANGYGMSATLANLVLEATLTGGTVSFNTVCAQVHVNGTPGADGTSNPASETNRLQLNMSVTAITAAMAGTGPSWTITAEAGEKITALSLWSGFETDPDAVFLYSLPVPNVQVAFGDVVTLNSLILAATSTGLAS